MLQLAVKQTTNTKVAIRVAVIDQRNFSRESLVRCFQLSGSQFVATGYTNIEAWLPDAGNVAPDAVLLCLSDLQRRDVNLGDKIAVIRAVSPKAPIILISDSRTSIAALGARGIHIDGNVGPDNSFDDIAAMVRRHHADYNSLGSAGGKATDLETVLSQRERQIILALREGFSNRDIAIFLEISELTVKVHIRHIMQKLKAKNRAHIVYLSNSLS